jgi:DHA1 family bicyclomycin/chloramphenicol resistance-like MFS transporter
MMRGFGMLLSSPRFCVLALFPAFSSMVFFSFISGAPYVMVTLLDRPATEYGLYFMGVVAGFMLGNFLTIRLGSRIPLMRMMMIGAYVMVGAVGILGGCIGAGLVSPLTLFVPTALAQVGQGLALPNAQAAVINLVPHRAGTASSVTGFLQMVAAAIASQLVGTLQNGTAWPLVLMMGAGALGALTVMGIARTMLARKDRS